MSSQTHRRVNHRVSRRLFVAAVIGLVGVVVCYLLFVRTAAGHRFDNAAYLGSKEAASTDRNGIAHLLELINASTFAVALLGLVAIGAIRHRIVAAITVAVAAGVAVVGTDAVRLAGPARPFLTATDRIVPSRTFPSGHTAAAVAGALALMVVCAPRWRGWVAVVAGGYAAATAAQVQLALWHRPSDTFGGALLAFALVTGAAALVARVAPVTRVRPAPYPVAFTLLGITAMISAAGTAWGLVRIWDWLSSPARDETPSAYVRHDAYLTGLAATVLLVVVLVTALLVLMRSADLDDPRNRAGWVVDGNVREWRSPDGGPSAMI